MKKHPFIFTMRIYERITGIVYIPIHAVYLSAAVVFVLNLLNISLSSPKLNLLCYAISAVFLLLVMNHYWRQEMQTVAKSPLRTVQAVILGYAAYLFMDWLLYFLVFRLLDIGSNPNTSAVIYEMTLDSGAMIVVAAVLAPIVEEGMFRGALFGTLRTKSRLLAYIISAVVFGLYHIWYFFLYGGDAAVLVYILQYLPASLAFAWSYEWAGNIYAPVIIHSLINIISTVSIQWSL